VPRPHPSFWRALGPELFRHSLADTGNIVVQSEGTLLQYRFILVSTSIYDALGDGIMDAAGPFPTKEMAGRDAVMLSSRN
jgi:hypothetical protein